MRLLFLLPGGKISNEIDTVTAAPGVEVLTLGATADGRPADLELPRVRLPYLGADARWTAALAWYRGLDDLDPGPIDAVLTLELFGATSDQAVRLADRLGVPLVVSLAEMFEDKFLYRLPPWRGYAQNVVRAGALFICDTEMAADHAVALGCPADRTVTVHPGVDTELFHPAPELPSEPVVVTVGSLRPGKGIPDVIRAADTIVDRVPGLRLVVIGDGPLRSEVDDLAADRPYVELRGARPRHEVAEELRRARLFATAPYDHRGWAEQFGFALVEAMASGLPVVATSNGVIPEVAAPGTTIVAPRDPVAMGEAMLETIGPDAAERGRINRETAVARYRLQTQGERLARVLRTHLT